MENERLAEINDNIKRLEEMQTAILSDEILEVYISDEGHIVMQAGAKQITSQSEKLKSEIRQALNVTIVMLKMPLYKELKSVKASTTAHTP